MEPRKAIRFDLFGSSSTMPYEGEITGNRFSISRIIGYRNSFLPQISGVIQADVQGTIVRVKMGLHPLVIAFLCAWVGFAGMLLPVSIASLFGSRNQFEKMDLLPLGMLVFVYALTMGGFKFESSRSRNDLLELFEAEIITKETI
ncbi:hypothetical protein IC229_07695 [Spirosoma sp. BT702]|uniref:Uncharacterized protein n=1 Tax=Spirosoma profusum TaxID=2771354 RepID=A0A927ATL1_9BACT|nr:hypothetical protein [Spirosoma profusum]MBD2700512.1 hypothetical protein [Spirosoma profusum]